MVVRGVAEALAEYGGNLSKLALVMPVPSGCIALGAFHVQHLDTAVQGSLC